MPATCWDTMCGPDCSYCVYKQTRYRQGFSTPCYAWFKARKVEKKCKDCRYYLEQRKLDPGLPEDPAWHSAPGA